MIMTEKLFFRGTPAQFCAVMIEYRLDAKAVGEKFNCEITYPTDEVIVPNLSIPKNRSDTLPDILEMYNKNTGPTRHHIVNLRPESPRTETRCRIMQSSLIEFTVTALMRGGGGTQLTLRASEDNWEIVKGFWNLIVSYMDNLGYLEDSDTVKHARLLEPEDWPAALNEKGFAANSIQWWEMIEKWTLDYWTQYGTNSLPIGGKNRCLARCIGSSRNAIYTHTSLHRKKGVTQDDTE